LEIVSKGLLISSGAIKTIIWTHDGKEGVEEENATADNIGIAYPNPTENYVNFDFKLPYYNLYDLKGNLVRSGTNTTRIDLEGLPAGTYLMTTV
jgi:hypothetical protein